MNIISSILNTFVGNKSKKDLKKVEGIVKKFSNMNKASHH